MKKHSFPFIKESRSNLSGACFLENGLSITEAHLSSIWSWVQLGSVSITTMPQSLWGSNSTTPVTSQMTTHSTLNSHGDTLSKPSEYRAPDTWLVSSVNGLFLLFVHKPQLSMFQLPFLLASLSVLHVCFSTYTCQLNSCRICLSPPISSCNTTTWPLHCTFLQACWHIVITDAN